MSERVTIRVDEGDKEKWQRAAAESREYESMTHLIELAVHRELNGKHSSTSGGESDGARVQGYDPDVTNGEILQRIKDVQRQIEDVDQTVSAVENEVTATPVPDAREFFDALPDTEDAAVTPEQLSEKFQYADADNAADVLEQLERETGRVQTTVQVGETHYYKEV